jgi:hypothetical protein
MAADGMSPIPYHEFLSIMEGFGITEACGEPAECAEELGCKVLVRHPMATGTTAATVRVESPDAIIYPPEIRHALKQLGMSVQCFLDAVNAPLDGR